MLEKVDLCTALVIAIIILLLIHIFGKWHESRLNTKTERLTIREQNRPGTAYTGEVYHDLNNADLTIDDAYAMLKGKIPAVRVIMYHRLNCSEFQPMATVFRTVKEKLECPQIRFYEEVVDALNPLDYESYPLVIKIFKDGITGIEQIAKYDQGWDPFTFNDWVLNEKIETLPRTWVRTFAGEVHTSIKGEPYIPLGLRDYIPCSSNCGDAPYPTSSLNPMGTSHNFM
jgi:hypothetical protein